MNAKKYKVLPVAIGVNRRFDPNQFAYGVRRFVIGMGKKMILANPMGEVVDTILAMNPEYWSFSTVWLGALCFSLQVYFDSAAIRTGLLALGE